MVATLVRLRWRLTLNSLKANVWALIGTIVGALLNSKSYIFVYGLCSKIGRAHV